MQIIAYQIADDINIRQLKQAYKGQLIGENASELFYRLNDGHIFIINYGVVVFANIDDIERTQFIRLIQPMCVRVIEKQYLEDFTMHINDTLQKPIFDYNSMTVPAASDGLIRVTMLQVGQSCALDYYLETAQKLFDETTKLTTQLEEHGHLIVSKKNLLKFIGRTLNTKNRIFDNLYVMDAPPVVWDDELLGHVNNGLNKTFDISVRFRQIEYMLRIIEDNLDAFIELTNVRQSHVMEVIIIILIAIEVLDMMVRWFS